MSTVYFATKPSRQFISDFNDVVMMWSNVGTTSNTVLSGIFSTVLRNYTAYYSPMVTAETWLSSLGFGGEQGELIKVTVPTSRALARQYVSLITRQRLIFETFCDVSKAQNNALQVAKLGKAVCNHEVDRLALDRKLEEVAEQAYVLGASYFYTTWNPDKGAPYMGQAESAVYAGDVDVCVLPVYDVFYDWREPDWGKLDWVGCRTYENKWNLAAKYPEYADKLANFQPIEIQIGPMAASIQGNNGFGNAGFGGIVQNDRIPVIHFYHKPTPALPNGRYVSFTGTDIVFFDDAMPYQEIPITQVKFENIMGTGLGFAPYSCLLPAQEMQDNAISTQATNQVAFGVQNVLNPQGSDIDVTDIGGINFISYRPAGPEGGGKPEPLQLCSTPPEVPAFAQAMERLQESLSGISSTVRGQPPAGVTSGTAIATLSANTMEFLSSASKSLTLAMEDVMRKLIKTKVRYATTEQIANVTDATTFGYVKSYVGSDLEPITNVKIRQQSAIMNSVAGRVNLAESLIQKGLIKDVQEYFDIIEGRPVSDMYSVESAENAAIEAEVEALLNNETVQPLITDNHPEFIRQLQGVVYHPEVRRNSPVFGDILAVIQQRISLENQLPPEMKAMLRKQAPPPPPPGGPQTAPVPPPSNVGQGKAQPAQPKQPPTAV